MMVKPRLFAGVFHVWVGLEWADAVAEFVPVLDEPVDFLVLGVYLFFEFALGFDEVLVGGGEVAASGDGPCDGAAYCYAGESDDG